MGRTGVLYLRLFLVRVTAFSTTGLVKQFTSFFCGKILDMKNDPYHDHKVVHKANKIDQRGRASAICFDPPRAINMKVAKYVFSPENDSEVTCKKCLKQMSGAN